MRTKVEVFNFWEHLGTYMSTTATCIALFLVKKITVIIVSINFTTTGCDDHGSSSADVVCTRMYMERTTIIQDVHNIQGLR